jgi:hypothetical protein
LHQPINNRPIVHGRFSGKSRPVDWISPTPSASSMAFLPHGDVILIKVNAIVVPLSNLELGRLIPSPHRLNKEDAAKA